MVVSVSRFTIRPSSSHYIPTLLAKTTEFFNIMHRINAIHKSKRTITTDIDENDAQKRAMPPRVDMEDGIKKEKIPRHALAERKPNNQNFREEQEKKKFSRVKYGGDFCMVSVEDAEDIDTYMRYIEPRYEIPADFLRGNNGVDGRMRQILVDWLLHVQSRFKFHIETFSLAVNILDRSLVLMSNINKTNLQLLGVACFFCATKFEEITIPRAEDLTHISADGFNKEDIYSMEQQVLCAINFDLGIPHSIQFLRRYRFYVSPDTQTYQFAKYITEVAIVCYKLAHYPPSTVAAVAIWLASYISGQTISPLLFTEVFKLDFDTVTTIARSFIDPIIQMSDPTETGHLYALRKKYGNLLEDVLTDARLCLLREFSDFGFDESATSLSLQK